MDDELLHRLQDADPARTDAPAASWIDDLVEEAMNDEREPAPSRRTWMLAGAAAVAVIAGGVGFAVMGGDDEPDRPSRPSVTELALPASDPMMMCVQFSVDALRPMETAFSATAAEVEGEAVLLEVDHWYAGGDADQVRLLAGSPAVLLEGGITFTEGERYLVTATEGTVNTCGFSGAYTDEMAAAYEEAF